MPGHYVATATAALWVAVAPGDLVGHVTPTYYTDVPGSVQDSKYRTAKPLEVGCPVTDKEGRVVGFSLNCKGSDK